MRALAKLARAVDLRDLLALAGIGLVSWGAYLYAPPAGYVSAGAMLFYLGVFHGGRSSR